MKIYLFSPWYSWKIAELALKKNHSLTHSDLHCNKDITRKDIFEKGDERKSIWNSGKNTKLIKKIFFFAVLHLTATVRSSMLKIYYSIGLMYWLYCIVITNRVRKCLNLMHFRKYENRKKYLICSQLFYVLDNMKQ